MVREGAGKRLKAKQTSSEITSGVEERIVEVSLKHPDYGARRLVALLEEEGFLLMASTVYTILKRYNLQNRILRLSKLEEQCSAGTDPAPASATPPTAEKQDHLPAHGTERTPQPRISPAIKAPKKSNPRPPWSLSVPNLILLGIIGYFWFSAIGNFLQARHEQPTLSTKPEPTQTAPKSEVSIRPLEDYSIITERNLFGTASKDEDSTALEEINLEELPPAGKDLGLKLLGTVSSDMPGMRVAIIEEQTAHKESMFREGEQVGQALIKKIFRNTVIINASNGDLILSINLEEGKGKDTPAINETGREKKIEKRKRPRRAKRTINRTGTRDRQRIRKQRSKRSAAFAQTQ